MGYFTYRVFKDVSVKRLRSKVEANLALYERGTVGRESAVHLLQGTGCSALCMDYLTEQEQFLRPLGYQFGCVWMDVRFQDGDWWDVSLYEGTEHRCSHSVNPWAHEERYRYDQSQIDFRIGRICEFWPRFGDRLRPYLLPWRIPVRRLGRIRYVPRTGKAHAADKHAYGDADQIYDFMRVFGIHEDSPKETIQAAA